MSSADRLPTADLPDTPQARQLRAGFPWLTFNPELETEFRCAHFDENLLHTRVNFCLAVVITIAFSAMESIVLGPELNRIPSMIHLLVIIPILLIGFASSFSARRHRIYPPLAVVASTILGLGVAEGNQYPPHVRPAYSARLAASRARGGACGGAAGRYRLLQGLQRPLRTSGGRRMPARRGRLAQSVRAKTVGFRGALWRRRVRGRAVRSEPRIRRRGADSNSALHSRTQYSPRRIPCCQPADGEHPRGLHPADPQSHARLADPTCRRSVV